MPDQSQKALDIALAQVLKPGKSDRHMTDQSGTDWQAASMSQEPTRQAQSQGWTSDPEVTGLVQGGAGGSPLILPRPHPRLCKAWGTLSEKHEQPSGTLVQGYSPAPGDMLR